MTLLPHHDGTIHQEQTEVSDSVPDQGPPTERIPLTELQALLKEGLPADTSEVMLSDFRESTEPERIPLVDITSAETDRKSRWPRVVAAAAVAGAVLAGALIINHRGDASSPQQQGTETDAEADPTSAASEGTTTSSDFISPGTIPPEVDASKPLGSDVLNIIHPEMGSEITLQNAQIMVQMTLNDFKGYIQTGNMDYLKASLDHTDGDFQEFTDFLTDRSERLKTIYKFSPWHLPFNIRIGDPASFSFSPNTMEAHFAMEMQLPYYYGNTDQPDVIEARDVRITYVTKSLAIVDPVTKRATLKDVWLADGVQLGEATIDPPQPS